MKFFIVVIVLSFLLNAYAQAGELNRSVTTQSGEPPPPPPPWAQSVFL